MRLTDELEVPLRERNTLLLAAGYAPVYAERSLDSPEMETVKQALEVDRAYGDLRPSEILLPLRLRDRDGDELAFFSTLSTFGTAVDITLSELAIEAFYPANARTAMRLLSEIDPR